MTTGRHWDADAAHARAAERRRDKERRLQQRPTRVPADNVYALLERTSRRESLAARTDTRFCALCARRLTPRTLTVDHATARALGGADHGGNLQATCQRCNNVKSRLEGAVQARRQRGVAFGGDLADLAASFPNEAERERFLAHPTVQTLLAALRPPTTPPAERDE